MNSEETRKICIASGKGGVGKTVVTANLGISLAQSGVKTILVDADLDMANLEMILGMEGRPITLQDVMKDEADIEDSIYNVRGQENLKFVPAGISPNQFRRMDPDKFKRIIDQLTDKTQMLILDSPAGIGKDTISCFNACEETLLVVTPESISAADASKAKNASEKMGAEVKGAIVNRIHEKRYGMNDKEITSFLNTPILVKIKEDPKVRKAVSEKEPMIDRYPEHEFSQRIKELTKELIGKRHIKKKPKKKGLLSKLKGIFSR